MHVDLDRTQVILHFEAFKYYFEATGDRTAETAAETAAAETLRMQELKYNSIIYSKKRVLTNIHIKVITTDGVRM